MRLPGAPGGSTGRKRHGFVIGGEQGWLRIVPGQRVGDPVHAEFAHAPSRLLIAGFLYGFGFHVMGFMTVPFLKPAPKLDRAFLDTVTNHREEFAA